MPLMSNLVSDDQNECFYGEIRKILTWYPLLSRVMKGVRKILTVYTKEPMTTPDKMTVSRSLWIFSPIFVQKHILGVLFGIALAIPKSTPNICFCTKNSSDFKQDRGRSRLISEGLIKLLYLLCIFGQTGLGKQCRLRSEDIECIWSWSILFTTHPAIFTHS